MENRKLSLDELGRMEVEEFKASSKMPLVVILDDIRSALNVGSIFRTSDCFAVKKILLSGITAKPPHKEIFKTAIGATESVDWEYFESITQAINSLENTSIISVEQTTNSVSLDDIKNIELKSQVAIILGNEVNGVSETAIELSDYCLEIPQYGTKHSFNVSVCCGIVCHSFSNLLRGKI